MDAAGSFAGLFGLWAIVATAVAVYQYRRLRDIDEATGFRGGLGDRSEPRVRAAAAALRRFADPTYDASAPPASSI